MSINPDILADAIDAVAVNADPHEGIAVTSINAGLIAAEYARLVPAEDEGRLREALLELLNRHAFQSDHRGMWPHEYDDGRHRTDCRGCTIVALAATPERPTEDEGRLREALYKAVGSITDARVAELMEAADVPLHGHPISNAAGYVAARIRGDLKERIDAALAATPETTP